MKKGKWVLAHLAGRGKGQGNWNKACIGQVLGVITRKTSEALLSRSGLRLQVCATVNTSVAGLNIMNFINARYNGLVVTPFVSNAH
jgi:hypothetical protein